MAQTLGQMNISVSDDIGYEVSSAIGYQVAENYDAILNWYHDGPGFTATRYQAYFLLDTEDEVNYRVRYKIGNLGKGGPLTEDLTFPNLEMAKMRAEFICLMNERETASQINAMLKTRVREQKQAMEEYGIITGGVM